MANWFWRAWWSGSEVSNTMPDLPVWTTCPWSERPGGTSPPTSSIGSPVSFEHSMRLTLSRLSINRLAGLSSKGRWIQRTGLHSPPNTCAAISSPSNAGWTWRSSTAGFSILPLWWGTLLTQPCSVADFITFTQRKYQSWNVRLWARSLSLLTRQDWRSPGVTPITLSTCRGYCEEVAAVLKAALTQPRRSHPVRWNLAYSAKDGLCAIEWYRPLVVFLQDSEGLEEGWPN